MLAARKRWLIATFAALSAGVAAGEPLPRTR
jgi:hypothetical protein